MISSFRGHAPWTLRSDSTTSPSKATSRQSGQQARGRSRSALPARRNQHVSGGCSFWNAQEASGRSQYMDRQMPEQSEGAAPASSESATRIRALSASACGRRARRDAGGHVDLPARTGAVQVDVGVAGAVRVPAVGVAAGSLGGCRCWLEMFAEAAGGRVTVGEPRGDPRSSRRRGGVLASASA